MDFKDMFERTDLKSIERFVLNNGVPSQNDFAEDYSVRITQALKNISDYVESKFPDGDEADELWEKISLMAEIYRETYFDAGMRMGAKLGYQLGMNI